MKRILSFVLAFALLISSAPFAAAESSRPTVTVQTVTAQAGDTVAVDVVVSNVVASSYQMTVQHDEALKLVEIQEGEASLGMMNANVETGKVADFALTDKKIDGVIFTLIFEIAADAKAGLCEIALDLQGFTDLLGQVIAVDVFSGGIEILPEETEPTAPSEEPIPSEPIVPTEPVPTEPAVAPVLTVQTVEARPGETVTLAVVMSATRYASYELQVFYSNWLTLVEIEEGDEAVGVFLSNVDTGIISDFSTKDRKVDGEIFLLTFEVSPYAKKGLLEVTLNVKGFYNAANEQINVDLISGGVLVTEDGIDPTEPTEPAPSEPVPTEPTEPAPSEPVPTEPTEPAPSEPVPTEPTEPIPTEPAPTVPTEPIPTEPIPTEPEPNPVLTVGTVDARPGETVTLAVTMSATKYAGYELYVAYGEGLKLVEIIEGDETVGMFTGNVESGIISDFTAKDKKVNGEIFLLTFEVSPYAKKGLLDVTLEIKGFYMADKTELAVDLIPGGIFVTEDGIEEPAPTAPTEPTPTNPEPTEPAPTEPPTEPPTETNPVLTVGTVDARPGETVTIAVVMSATQYASYELGVVYGKWLTLVEIEEGDEAVGMFTADVDSGIIVDYTSRNKNVDGEIFLLTFEVSPYAKKGLQEVTLNIKGFYKANGGEITVDLIPGGIYVTEDGLDEPEPTEPTEPEPTEPEPTEPPEPTPVITVGTVNGRPGDTVTVAVSVSDMNCVSYQLTVLYDTAAMTLVEILKGEEALGDFAANTNTGIIHDFANSDKNLNGNLFYLVFEIAEDATAGLTEVALKIKGFYKADQSTIAVDVISGGVNISQHNYVATVTAPTCTEQGYTTYVCANCGASYVANYVAATGHTYDSGVVIKTPACTTEGEKIYTCHCGHTKVEAVAPLGHTPGDEVYENFEQGSGETFCDVVQHCTVCGEECGRVRTSYLTLTVETVQIGPGNTVTLMVNVTAAKFASYELSVKYDDRMTLVEIEEGDESIGSFTANASTGKIVDYTTKNKKANGTIFLLTFEIPEDAEEGLYEVSCNVSGFYKADRTKLAYDVVSGGVIVHEHSYTATKTEPTCVSEGYTTYTCSCGDSYVSDRVAALGHAWDDGTITTAPTCTEEGVRTYTCHNCAATRTEVVTATGHSYKAEKTAPTCTEQGYTTYTCHCGDSYVADYVAALGHAWDDGTITTAPTCTEEGVKTYTCRNCAATRTETVAATGHSYATEKTAPTCTEQGYTTYTCHCGDTYKADYVNALGHRASAAVEENRHYENGVCYVDRVVYCNVCKAELSREKTMLFTLGDVNNDGEISVLDAMLVAQYIVGDIDENGIIVASADVNGDGEINVLDAMLIAQYIVGDISRFPAEN